MPTEHFQSQHTRLASLGRWYRRATWHIRPITSLGIFLLGLNLAATHAMEPVPSGEIKPLPPVESGQTSDPQPFELPVPRPDDSLHFEPSATGEEAASLSLEYLENIALQNNPTLSQAQAKIEAATGKMIQAGLVPNPILGYQGEEIGDEQSLGQQGFFVSQEIMRREKRALSRVAGSYEVSGAQHQAQIQQLRVLSDVRSEHFNVLVAQRAEELAKDVHQINKLALEKTEQLYAGKFVPYTDVLQARIQEKTADIAVANARTRYRTAWQHLATVIGMPNITPRRLIGELNPPTGVLEWNDMLTRLYKQSPELVAAHTMVAWRRSQLMRAKVEKKPNILYVLGLQQDTESNSLIGDVQIGLPIPILNNNRGNIQTAYAELRNAEAEVARVQLAIRKRLASVYEIYQNSRTEVDQYTRNILPDAHAALKLVIEGYQQQQFNFLTVLNAQRTYAQANLAYLRSLQEFGTTRIALKGFLLGGSLNAANNLEAPELDIQFTPAFGPAIVPVETN